MDKSFRFYVNLPAGVDLRIDSVSNCKDAHSLHSRDSISDNNRHIVTIKVGEYAEREVVSLNGSPEYSHYTYYTGSVTYVNNKIEKLRLTCMGDHNAAMSLKFYNKLRAVHVAPKKLSLVITDSTSEVTDELKKLKYDMVISKCGAKYPYPELVTGFSTAHLSQAEGYPNLTTLVVSTVDTDASFPTVKKLTVVGKGELTAVSLSQFPNLEILYLDYELESELDISETKIEKISIPGKVSTNCKHLKCLQGQLTMYKTNSMNVGSLIEAYDIGIRKVSVPIHESIRVVLEMSSIKSKRV